MPNTSLKDPYIPSVVRNTFFVFSSIFLCILLYYNYWLGSAITLFVSIILTALITGIYLFKFNFFLLFNITKLLSFPEKVLCTFISIFAIICLSNFSYFYWQTRFFSALLSIYATNCYVTLIYTFAKKCIKSFWRSLSLHYQKLFIIFLIINIVFSIAIFLCTSLFSTQLLQIDSFIGFDTGHSVAHDFGININYEENDARHLLMSLAILPFAILPKIIANLLPFIPHFDVFLLCIVQATISTYCTIRLMSLLQIKDNTLSSLLVALATCCSAVFINMLVIEKFVFVLFYITTTIYYSLQKSSLKWIFFVGSVSILTTNIFLLPIILLTDKKPLKTIIKECLIALLAFVCILIIFGQLNRLFFIVSTFTRILRFSSLKASPPSTLYVLAQYIIFIANLFFVPATKEAKSFTLILKQPFFSHLIIFGIILLILSLLGYILNHKNTFAKICMYWQIFMFLILAIFGWGSPLNEMFIYSSIFFWSTFALVIMFFNSVAKTKRKKIICISTLLSVVVIYNIIEFIPLLQFAIKYYNCPFF